MINETKVYLSKKKFDELTEELLHFGFLLGDNCDGPQPPTENDPAPGNPLMVLINAHHDEIGFVLPAYHPGNLWKMELDTSHEAGLVRDGTFEGTHAYPLQGRSFVLMREMDPGTPT